MQLSEFYKALVEHYGPLEGRALASFFLREAFGIESHRVIVEPSLEVSGLEEAGGAGAGGARTGGARTGGAGAGGAGAASVEDAGGAMAASVEDALSRLLADEPVDYILGYKEFYGRRFNVSPAVLIPRPETEELCAKVVEWASRGAGEGLRIVDFCTGSGCIAWTLAAETGARVVGVDISSEALDVARRQFGGAGAAGVAGVAGVAVGSCSAVDDCVMDARQRVEFRQEDVLGEADSFWSALEGRVDIVVSNPPYIMNSEKSAMNANVLDWEPSIALFAPDSDALVFYRAVARRASRLLKRGGLLAFEINEKLGPEMVEMLKGQMLGADGCPRSESAECDGGAGCRAEAEARTAEATACAGCEGGEGGAGDADNAGCEGGAGKAECVWSEIRVEKDLFGKDRFVLAVRK